MLSYHDRRLALTDWRDDWLAQIWGVMGDAAQRTRVDLEHVLPAAGLWNVYADQRAFADPRVDRSMRRVICPFLDRFKALAAPSLQAIDPALGGISVTLWQTDLEQFLPDEPADIPELTVEEAPLSPTGTAVAKTVIGSGMALGAKFVFGGPVALAMGVQTLADVASPKFRHWILDAGSKRLANTWIGGEREGSTVAGRLAAVLDDAFLTSRKVLA